MLHNCARVKFKEKYYELNNADKKHNLNWEWGCRDNVNKADSSEKIRNINVEKKVEHIKCVIWCGSWVTMRMSEQHAVKSQVKQVANEGREHSMKREKYLG